MSIWKYQVSATLWTYLQNSSCFEQKVQFSSHKKHRVEPTIFPNATSNFLTHCWSKKFVKFRTNDNKCCRSQNWQSNRKPSYSHKFQNLPSVMWLESQSATVAKKKKMGGKAALLISSHNTWYTSCAVIISPPLPAQYDFHERPRAQCSVLRKAQMPSAQWEVPRNAADGALTHSISLQSGANPETPKIPSCTLNLEYGSSCQTTV